MIYKNILLVDDDEDDQYIFLEILAETKLAVKCSTSKNGLEAIEFLYKSKIPPSIIFLDLNMPLMNGFEFLANLKSVDCFKEIPVVIFTTSDSLHDQNRAIELGANLFITKTCDFKELKAIIIKILLTSFKKSGAIPRSGAIVQSSFRDAAGNL